MRQRRYDANAVQHGNSSALRAGVLIAGLMLSFGCPAAPASAQTPDSIPDAPLTDDSSMPSPSQEINASSGPKTPWRDIDHRVYWLSSYEFSPEGSATPAISPPALLSRQAPMRSSHLQMNGEFSKRFLSRLFIKMDLQADYFPHNDEDDSYGIRLNELFLEYRFSPAFSFLAGKYRRMYGPGLFQNPMDLYTPVSYLPGQPLQREGAYLLQLTWTPPLAEAWISDPAITAAFLPCPFIDAYGLPVKQIEVSRIAGFGTTVTASESWSAKRLGGFIRGYANLAGGDANAMLYYYKTHWQLGGSYSRYVVSPWLEAHAEALHYRLARDRAQSDPSSYWDAVTGIRIEPWSMSGLILEWLHADERPTKLPSSLPGMMQLFNGFLAPETHLTAAMPFRDYLVLTVFGQPWKDRLTMRGNAIIHPEGNDALWTLRGDLALGDHTQLSLTGMLVSAASGGYYAAVLPFPWRLTVELWMYL